MWLTAMTYIRSSTTMSISQGWEMGIVAQYGYVVLLAFRQAEASAPGELVLLFLLETEQWLASSPAASPSAESSQDHHGMTGLITVSGVRYLRPSGSSDGPTPSEASSRVARLTPPPSHEGVRSDRTRATGRDASHSSPFDLASAEYRDRGSSDLTSLVSTSHGGHVGSCWAAENPRPTPTPRRVT